jgi:hypothetical protein
LHQRFRSRTSACHRRIALLQTFDKPPLDGATRNDLRRAFVDERVLHIILKSIANNSRIDRQGIDAAIAQAADVEKLCDRPLFANAGRVRIVSPFTVEGAPLPNFCRTV